MIDMSLLLAKGDDLGKFIFPVVVMAIYAIFTVVSKVLTKGAQQAKQPPGLGGPRPGARAPRGPSEVEKFLRQVMGEPEPQARPPEPGQDQFQVLQRQPGRADRDEDEQPAPRWGDQQRGARPGGPAGQRLVRAGQPDFPVEFAVEEPVILGDMTGDLERRVQTDVDQHVLTDVEQRVNEDMAAAGEPTPEERLPDGTAAALGALRRTPRTGLAALLGSGRLDLRSAIVVTEVFGPPRALRRGPAQPGRFGPR